MTSSLLHWVLPVPGPFHFPSVLAAARRGAQDPLNCEVGGRWRRAFGEVLLEAAPGEGGLAVQALCGQPQRQALDRGIVRLFGLDQDPQAVLSHPDVGTRFAGILRQLSGYRATGYFSLYEALVNAILAQQITLSFANVLRGRIVTHFGEPLRYGGETYFSFPPPERLLDAPLRPLGVSEAKQRYIRGIARAFAEGELSEDALYALPDDAVIARLTALPGVGRWTAEWLLLRGMGRYHVVPAGDLAVQKVTGQFLGFGRRLTEAEVRRCTAPWHPLGGIVIHYLLQASKAGIT